MRRFLSMFALMMLTAVLSFAQSRTVSGKVTDETGAPVAGASVLVVGTSSGTSTDGNGNFTLTGVAANARLRISGSGINEQTVNTGNSSTVNVFVTKRTEELSAVVVTALGIRKKADRVGYATARVDEKTITNGRATDIATGLSGKVSGLTISNNSSSVSGTPRIVLRGLRSLTGDNTALIVLDGVAVPANAIQFINPNDVERVDIMKGGQAATLFGSDGVNGAVIITTKKGNRRPEFNVSTSYNTESVAYLPRFQNLFGSGSAYGANMKENWNAAENQQYGDRYDGSIRSFGRALADGSVQFRPYSNVPGSRKAVWDNGSTRQTDVSYRGGDENSNMFISYQNLNRKGVVPGDKYQRNTFRFNAGRKYNKLALSFDANYSFDKTDGTNTDYYFLALNSSGWVPMGDYRDWRNNKFADPNGYFNDYYNSPYWTLDNVRFLQKATNFQGNVKAVYQMTKDLDVTARVAMSNTNTTTATTSNAFPWSDWAKSSAYAFDYLFDIYDGGSYGNGRSVAGSPVNGSLGESYSFGNRMNYDLFGHYAKDFGKHNLDLIIGASAQTREGKSTGSGTSAILFPDFYNYSNSYSGQYTASNSKTLQRKIGGYADATFGINSMVFIHGNVRNDYSSLFYDAQAGFKKPNFLYYGADISILLNKVLNLSSTKIDVLKLRAGYSKNGNDNLSPYQLRQIFPIGGGFPYNGLPGTTIGNTLVSPELTPEFVKTAEVGLEASFDKGRVNLEMSAYKQKSERQILNVSIDPASGYSGYRLNAADVDNMGYEADLKVQLIRKANSLLQFNTNFSYNTNKVKELYGDGGLTNLQFQSPDSRASLNAVKGEMFPSLQVTTWQRDSLGRVIVDSALGTPFLNPNKVTVGTTLPKYQIGFGLSYRWKNITIAANAEYRGGAVVYHDLGTDMAFTGSGAVTSIYQREQFVFPNSVIFSKATGKYIPNTNTAVNPYGAMYTMWGDVSNSNGLTGVGEVFYSSADFWKLRDISLSYDFPQSLFGSGKILRGASLSVFGRNLLTFLPKDNWYTDPELSNTNGNSQGINTTLNTPPTRQIGASLKLTF